MKSSSLFIQMEATEQFFSVMLFTMLSKVVLTFESVDDSHSTVYLVPAVLPIMLYNMVVTFPPEHEI